MFKRFLKQALIACLSFCVLGNSSLKGMPALEEAEMLRRIGTISVCSGVLVTGIGICALYGAYTILSKTNFSSLQDNDKSKTRVFMRIGGSALLGILGYKMSRSGLQLILGGGVILAGSRNL